MDPERAREWREWAAFVIGLAVIGAELYLLVPPVRFAVNDLLRRARSPMLERRRRELEARALMADVVELVAAGHVPPAWTESEAS